MIAEAIRAHLQEHHSQRTRWKPPTLDEIKAYIQQNPELGNVNADLFWKSFNDGGWIDTQGKPVRNWKLKLRTWSSHASQTIKKQPVKREIVRKCCECHKQKVESEMTPHPDYPWEWVCKEGCK